MIQPPEPPNPPATPTSADVARLAGVSRATVSYVLNAQASGRVSVRTQDRVRAAAEELGYVPHAAARALRAGHSGLVLLTTPSGPIPRIGTLFGDFLMELQGALHRLGYTSVWHGPVAGAGEQAARAWAELRPAAVLALPGTGLTPPAVELLKRSGTRAVLTLGMRPVAGAHALLLDQEALGTAAAGHLLDRGRRRIGVIMPTEPGLDLFSTPRLAGVRTAAAAGSGVHVEPLPLDCTEESAAELAARWPDLGLDSLFAYNDEYAMLVMRAFQDAGLTIPGDVAVVGADDLLLARLVRPRLTSVTFDTIPTARLVTLVDRAIRSPETPPETHQLTRVVVTPRDST
ncbi:LacI family DNA-binding transcriptional regulator [Streptomyces sp. NPDC006733]|uniref:LacI family DNA-binding transcriptional regulator n=1 Tax=Streptomyces sp. NPDC006733 TaxID=3155460 RepID=UPI0033E6FE30